MNLKRQRCLLEREIQATSYTTIFVEAQARHEILAKYGSTIELSKVLGATSKKRFPEKEALMQVVLTEHGERPRPLWAALLVLACYPMLSRLRGRIHGDSMSGDECDQLVISSFLEVVATYSSRPSRDLAFARLRHLTSRMVFQRVHHEQRELDRVRPTPPDELQMYEEMCIAEHRSVRWPETSPYGRRHRSSVERNEQVEFLERHAGEVLSDEKLAPVIATLVHGERLRQYVERTYPRASGDEHQRLYQRIKRRHSRAIGELRELFVQHREKHVVANATPAR